LFDVLEDRMNAAVLAKLANATADIGGETVTGVFGNESILIGDYVEGKKPVFTCQQSAIGSLAQGDASPVTYKTVTTNYTLGSKEPDGTGLVKLMLELP
jgi:hypothetical protein